MTAIYHTRHKGDVRVGASEWSSLLWRAMALTGVQIEWDSVCYRTYRLTKDARRVDEQRWEAPTALSSLCRAIRLHPALAGDILIRMLLFRVAVDYICAVLDERGL